jgi:undecaprenyl-diphosphatase
VDVIYTLILSALEGVTEFLPISSTGHLILASQILHIPQTEFVKSFEIIIQFGAILAVVVLYWKKLLNTKIWPTIIAAFIPAAVIGFTFFKIIKDVLIGNSFITVLAMFLGGFILIAIEYWKKKRDNSKDISGVENINIKNAFVIGIFQAFSVIPGTSRAAASVVGALLLKIDRKTAAEFSFLLAIPTVFAASVLDIFESKLSFTNSELLTLALGLAASFLFALITVRWFIAYLSKHDFIAFGVYRIVLAIIFYITFLR